MFLDSRVGCEGTIVVIEAGRGNRIAEFPPILRGLLCGSLHGHTGCQGFRGSLNDIKHPMSR